MTETFFEIGNQVSFSWFEVVFCWLFGVIAGCGLCSSDQTVG